MYRESWEFAQPDLEGSGNREVEAETRRISNSCTGYKQGTVFQAKSEKPLEAIL